MAGNQASSTPLSLNLHPDPETHLRRKKKPKPPNLNPITTAVNEWLDNIDVVSAAISVAAAAAKPSDQEQARPDSNQEASSPANTNATLTTALRDSLVSSAPKRWTLSPPLLLLPSGSFSSPHWSALLSSLPSEKTRLLWEGVLDRVSHSGVKVKVTRLAVNEGIPALKTSSSRDKLEVVGTAEAAAAGQEEHEQGENGVENVLRSPTGLRMLYGDFGPTLIQHDGEEVGEQDFKAAFWVHTTQNGIFQTWAPRWTMFSRGNITEKGRLLCFHDPPKPGAAPAAKTKTPLPTPASETAHHHHDPAALDHRCRTKHDLRGKWAVDLYAGIGYFVFSYARLGLRVLCWEINPWSVEGLRRAGERNKVPVRVVEGDELRRGTREILLKEPKKEEVGEEEEEEAQVVVVLESNDHAGKRVRELREAQRENEMDKEREEEEERTETGLEVLHVNCGLLPRSDASWRDALDILLRNREETGWLHLHENVGVKDIEARRKEIQDMFDGWCGGTGHTSAVEHVELVKTFAPGVWHCVFDVCVSNTGETVGRQNE